MAVEPKARAVPVAIVGTGRVARYHAAGYAGHGDRCEVVACADPTLDKCREFCRAYAGEHGRAEPRAHDDLGAMLRAHRPRLVSVCTPPGSHADVAAAALEAGAWAYVEKPFCTSLAELERVFEAERRGGGRACGVVQWRSAGSARHFLDLAKGGEFGRLLAAHCGVTWFRDDAYFAVPWRGRWATEAGGTVVSHAVHGIDLMLAVEAWREVRATAATVARGTETEDVAAAAVGFEGGGVGTVLASAVSPRQQSLLRFDFERATVELDHFTFFTRANWRVTPAPGHEAVLRAWEAMPSDDPPRQGTQLGPVLDAVSRGDRDATGLVVGEELRRTLEFLTALYKSAQTGLPVAAGSIGPGDPFHRHLGGPAAGVA